MLNPGSTHPIHLAIDGAGDPRAASVIAVPVIIWRHARLREQSEPQGPNHPRAKSARHARPGPQAVAPSLPQEPRHIMPSMPMLITLPVRYRLAGRGQHSGWRLSRRVRNPPPTTRMSSSG